ncbi:MAG: 16S rRNA (cytidine(1402)-2'-O)-methyltransferase [Woeseiaceae bacterium]
MSGTLYIVATPIGNLDDLSPRARQTLADVDLIAAEDTRHTGRLLSHIGAKTPQKALHDHNESDAVPAIIDTLLAGKNVALASDAGTPLVSDPGYRLVKAAHENGIAVSPIPGPSAALAALSSAGLPTDRFAFEGFLPSKAMARAQALTALSNEQRTLIFFESVHRVADVVDDMIDAFGKDRPAFIGRELSKLHEQCVSSTLGELARDIGESIAEKGEFVLVVGGAPQAESSIDADALLTELLTALPGKQAVAITAKICGGNRNAIYERMLELRGNSS